ncbi:MAG: DUF4278 domain-containing protein [Chloroflexaceae bacterium]|nr:DUF4278 domain-containing protein [Chloroflexaceae bacterium]
MVDLKFRGVSYRYEPQLPAAITTEVTGRFLGSTYQSKRHYIPKALSQQKLKFRGIAY